ncbi:hypothetical protein [Sphingomonas bacterium]|uniref:hypothetical protein n=1 Tax=Sphingomonas bacterium TaxID=1895847 RepID=UPI002622C053|nr:hypothetical protein [Sphingomonas bacterium]MDB5678723.1 hypothetical protein [Sphingomonas bacterium]
MPYYTVMPLSSAPFPPTGFAAARDALRRTWLTLAIVALVPASAAARIVPNFLTIGPTPSLSDNAPNLWSIVQALPWLGSLPLAGLAMAMAIGAAAWLAAYFSACPPRNDAQLPAALLIALALPGLLPYMQTHDFLLAVALSCALAIRRRSAVIAALVSIGYLLAVVGAAPFGAMAIIAATVLVARAFLTSPANDNGLPLNPYIPYPA